MMKYIKDILDKIPMGQRLIALSILLISITMMYLTPRIIEVLVLSKQDYINEAKDLRDRNEEKRKRIGDLEKEIMECKETVGYITDESLSLKFEYEKKLKEASLNNSVPTKRSIIPLSSSGGSVSMSLPISHEKINFYPTDTFDKKFYDTLLINGVEYLVRNDGLDTFNLDTVSPYFAAITAEDTIIYDSVVINNKEKTTITSPKKKSKLGLFINSIFKKEWELLIKKREPNDSLHINY